MSKTKVNKPDHEREAKRILERVERESESVGTSSYARAANKLTGHLAGQDADHDDWAELWGRRIGRGLSVIAFILLALWLIAYLTR